jgi:AraC family transcriptional regulator
MSLAFHPPGTDHHDEVEIQGARILTIEVADTLLDRLREESRPTLDFKVFAGGEPIRLSALLYRELRRGEPGTDLDVEELLFELLASSLCRPGVDETREPAWLCRVEALLGESFREALSLDRLAAEAGVHPGHLTRTFRRFRGHTPGEYLQQLRVRRVCEGLAHPEPPLVDLALEAGFADQSHCTRVFRRLIGLPPGAFRETLTSSG